MPAVRATLTVLFICLVISPCLADEDAARSAGYLRLPPVFLRDENEVPLATFGVYVPPARELRFCAMTAAPESDGFVSNGASVQPDLRIIGLSVGGGAMAGLGKGWGVGAMMPWSWTRARYLIGGQPAVGDAQGLGALLLFGKKMLWHSGKGDYLTGTFGVELPNGTDNATFAYSNPVTNAYYTNYPARMPLGWQPSNGAWNSHFVLGYLKTAGRTSHEAIFALKFHGAGDEDVRLGNILITSYNVTYGISKKIAAALGLVFRTQANDSYPNAPTPGVGQLALAGTTTHGTALFMDPTIRFDISRTITVGVGMRQTLIKPNDGMVPRSSVFLILYPRF